MQSDDGEVNKRIVIAKFSLDIYTTKNTDNFLLWLLFLKNQSNLLDDFTKHLTFLLIILEIKIEPIVKLVLQFDQIRVFWIVNVFVEMKGENTEVKQCKQNDPSENHY